MPTVLLFDVDGTLTPSGEQIKKEMLDCLIEIKNKHPDIQLGIVGGGTCEKISWQLNNNNNLLKYLFCECGSKVFIDGNLIFEQNILNFTNRDYLNSIIKEALKQISNMPIIFNGHQIDFRTGLIYISPPGMQSGKLERDYFKEMNTNDWLRNGLINKLKQRDVKNIFDIVLGGEVGVALYPKGWDKSQVMRHFSGEQIYYFGDRCEPDGNDYPLYSHKSVHGISVKNYQETINKLKELFLKD